MMVSPAVVPLASNMAVNLLTGAVIYLVPSDCSLKKVSSYNDRPTGPSVCSLVVPVAVHSPDCSHVTVCILLMVYFQSP